MTTLHAGPQFTPVPTPVGAPPIPEFRPADLARMSVEDATRALLTRAAELRASDLFLLSDERYVTVAARRLGAMERIAMLSTEFGRQIMSHIKAYAEMDISEKRRPADARWIVQTGQVWAISDVPGFEVDELDLSIFDKLN